MTVLLVSDLHANPAALEVLPDADAVVCAGDLVDYGPDPRAAIAFCRERAAVVVGGNHDVALGYDVSDGVTSAVAAAASETRRRHRAMLSDDELGWLRVLPHVARSARGTFCAGVAHAFPGDVRQYGRLQHSAEALLAALPGAGVLIVGHTHVQELRRVGDAVAVNPGSAGMGEAGGFADFAVWTDGEIALHRVPYDVERTLFAVRAAGADDRGTAALLDAFRRGRSTAAVPAPTR